MHKLHSNANFDLLSYWTTYTKRPHASFSTSLSLQPLKLHQTRVRNSLFMVRVHESLKVSEYIIHSERCIKYLCTRWTIFTLLSFISIKSWKPTFTLPCKIQTYLGLYLSFKTTKNSKQLTHIAEFA